MLSFRDISMEDKQAFEACSSQFNYHLCEHCFTDMYMWRSHYGTQICFADGVRARADDAALRRARLLPRADRRG